MEMGIYINPTKQKTPRDKLDLIRACTGEVSKEDFLSHVPGLNNIFGVCVVENPMFNAAGVAYSPGEAEVFADTGRDPRPRSYFLLTVDQIKELDPSAAIALERFMPEAA